MTTQVLNQAEAMVTDREMEMFRQAVDRLPVQASDTDQPAKPRYTKAQIAEHKIGLAEQHVQKYCPTECMVDAREALANAKDLARDGFHQEAIDQALNIMAVIQQTTAENLLGKAEKRVTEATEEGRVPQESLTKAQEELVYARQAFNEGRYGDSRKASFAALDLCKVPEPTIGRFRKVLARR